MADFKKRELSSDQPLGKQLKSVRTHASLSIEEVASLTKIRAKFIEALETGDYENFPAEVYARGFLENYADFLGFPADEVLLQYRRERGLGKREAAKPLPMPRARGSRSRLTITPRTIWAGLGVVGLVVAVGYLLTQLSGFASPPRLEIYKPAQNETVSSDTVEVAGKTDSGAELSINSQPVPTDPDGGFSAQVRIAPGANTIRVATKNKRGRERAVTRSVIVAGGSTTPTPTPAPAVSTGLLLTLRIGPNSAFLTVTVDGKQAFQGVLSPGIEQSFLANSRILVTTSNAGSTSVSINGQSQGPLGREGQYRQGVEYLPPAATPAPAASPG